MTVTENLAALGSWEIDLLPTIPRETLDALEFFGHIAIIHGRVDPATYGDSLLDKGVARYVGVLRGNSLADDARTNAPNDNIKISGVGMAFWLGDDDSKGDVIENATTFASGSAFPTVIRGLLPASGAVTEGILYSVDRTYAGTHQWQTSRDAIKYVCATVSTPDDPVNWRVNNDATLDAGPESDLFVTDPTCVMVARGDGEDMTLRGVPGSMNLTSDMEDYSTRVVLLAEGTGASIATGAADLAAGDNPYVDLHGNPLKLTRMVSESDTTATNADTRAQLALAQYTVANRDLKLGIQDYDVQGVFSVGDYIYCYDPDKGLVDTSQEIVFRGQRLNPITLQVVGVQWPVTAEYTVAYRAGDGTWYDLTDHIETHDAGTYVTVGSLQRQLSSTSLQPIGSRPSQDTSTPGVPTLVTPFQGAAYLDSRGFTRARVVLKWNAPLNVDGSTILDGDHYDIRYAVDTDMIYPATWSAVSQVRWEDMQSWAQPFAAPDDDWQTMVVGWDQATAQLLDLSPGVGYDVQIRAADSSGNTGAWSATTTFVATEDNIAPSTPAAASVAASRIAVQITHELGKASGGTFNLESDLDHLEIHGQYEPTYTPTDSTLLGKLKANAGMIQAEIPAVGTYQVESTDELFVKIIAVDIAGNRSAPSTAASATALLIDDAHISDLTVSKVTAGTITASWVMAGEIKTADTGARVRLSDDGIELYNAAGTRTLFGDASTGSLTMVGQLSSASDGRRVVVNPSFNPEIRFYADTGTDYSYINAFTSDDLTGIGLNGAPYTSGSNTLGSRVVVYPSDAGVGIETITSPGQVTHGGLIQVTPTGIFGRYAEDVTAYGYIEITKTGLETGFQSGGNIVNQLYMDADQLDLRYKPGTSSESSFRADDNGLTLYGQLRAQDSATQTFQVRSVSVSAGVSNMGVSYAITYPSGNPYVVGCLAMTAASGWQIVTTSSSSVNSIRAVTTGSAAARFIVTYGDE
jgi:hypothetical protein